MKGYANMTVLCRVTRYSSAPTDTRYASDKKLQLKLRANLIRGILKYQFKELSQ